MTCNVYDLNTLNKTSFKDILSCMPERNAAVFFGEVHQVNWIIRCELELAMAMDRIGVLGFLGLEMFNYRQQDLLDGYIEGSLSWEELVKEYSKGREGFDLEYYKPLIEYARSRGIKLIGVMPPREEAAKVARQGLNVVDDISDSPVSSGEIRLDYARYEDRILSMIPREGPMGRLDPRRILEAQAYKDTVIAAIVDRSLRLYGSGLVVTGWAHSEITGSAPTRLVERNPRASYLVITSRDEYLDSVRNELARSGGVLASFIALRE
ncbi:MAG: ChaN family lipoprotein [Desulfurococcales archaeon]|nr:ChaN family lipoprotein [Desulfurococcales archaeon]